MVPIRSVISFSSCSSYAKEMRELQEIGRSFRQAVPVQRLLLCSDANTSEKRLAIHSLPSCVWYR